MSLLDRLRSLQTSRVADARTTYRGVVDDLAAGKDDRDPAEVEALLAALRLTPADLERHVELRIELAVAEAEGAPDLNALQADVKRLAIAKGAHERRREEMLAEWTRERDRVAIQITSAQARVESAERARARAAALRGQLDRELVGKGPTT